MPRSSTFNWKKRIGPLLVPLLTPVMGSRYPLLGRLPVPPELVLSAEEEGGVEVGLINRCGVGAKKMEVEGGRCLAGGGGLSAAFGEVSCI